MLLAACTWAAGRRESVVRWRLQPEPEYVVPLKQAGTSGIADPPERTSDLRIPLAIAKVEEHTKD